jgi:hypothetical protein
MILRLSKSDEIVGIALEEALAIAVITISLGYYIRMIISAVGSGTFSCPAKNGFALISKLFREAFFRTGKQ